jgi:hypothetical protein
VTVTVGEWSARVPPWETAPIAEYELLMTRRIVRLAARRSSSYAPVVAAPDVVGVPVFARVC